jgi:uncharacterized membrane protein YphA (DoxX/SURF4 family)
MNSSNKWLKITGIVLNTLIAAVMILASSGKIFGFAPPQIVEQLTKFGLGDKIQLIGLGEMTSALLLMIPLTSPFGTLMTSGFWGGAICIHMANHEYFALQSAFLVITWLGSFLRGSVRLWAPSKASRSVEA